MAKFEASPSLASNADKPPHKPLTVGLLGFGEVGRVLAEDLRAGVIAADFANSPDVPVVGALALLAYDSQFSDPQSKPSRAAAELGLNKASDPLELAAAADVILCAVTAANDQLAAQSVVSIASAIRDTWYLDLNSASPEMKKTASKLIDSAGGRYIEAAVMSPIEPKRMHCPILLGGTQADQFLPIGQALGFSGMQVFADRVGPASATKMCRSVIVKGMEALLTESLLSARHYGVETHVLASLTDLFPLENWDKLARYMISRSIEHGVRRAEEMQEVTRTVREAGIEPLMSAACVRRQQWAPNYQSALGESELFAMLDVMLDGNRKERGPRLHEMRLG